jgi:Glycosyltransferase family 87
LTGNQTLIARTALSVIAGIIGIAAVSSARIHAIPRQSFDRFITIAFIISRLATYLGVFFILRLQPRGDIFFYWDDANSVLHGLLPYRDFISSYAPLHPYLDALAIRLWHTPLAIILLAVCVEFLLLLIWLHVGRSSFSEQEIRTAAILYFTSALSLQFVTIDGQDNVIIAALLALAVLLLHKNRALASGAAVGLGAVSIKFLPLLYAPLFFFSSGRSRWRWAAGLVLPVGLVYGAFAAKHLAILVPLSQEGNMKSANDLPYLVEAILGITVPSRIWDTLTLAALGIILALVARAIQKATSTLRLRIITFGMAALTLAIIVFAKKSWPPYLMLALFPICLLIPAASKLKTVAFAFFGVIAVVSPSYWATVFRLFSAQEFHQGLLAHQKSCFFFLAQQILLILGYIWLLIESLHQITSPTHPAAEDQPTTQPILVHSA